MPKAFEPQVATSNHLIEGYVIYFARPGWTRHLSDAAVATTAEDAEALLAEASRYPLETVDVVLTNVDISSGAPVPIHFREEFRTRGPSNYFHGKQAEHV